MEGYSFILCLCQGSDADGLFTTNSQLYAVAPTFACDRELREFMLFGFLVVFGLTEGSSIFHDLPAVPERSYLMKHFIVVFAVF